jgi:hypothetical protein
MIIVLNSNTVMEGILITLIIYFLLEYGENTVRYFVAFLCWTKFVFGLLVSLEAYSIFKFVKPTYVNSILTRRMALVNVVNVVVLNNPTEFTNPFQFEVTFECLQELQDGR